MFVTREKQILNTQKAILAELKKTNNLLWYLIPESDREQASLDQGYLVRQQEKQKR